MMPCCHAGQLAARLPGTRSVAIDDGMSADIGLSRPGMALATFSGSLMGDRRFVRVHVDAKGIGEPQASPLQCGASSVLIHGGHPSTSRLFALENPMKTSTFLQVTLASLLSSSMALAQAQSSSGNTTGTGSTATSTGSGSGTQRANGTQRRASDADASRSRSGGSSSGSAGNNGSSSGGSTSGSTGTGTGSGSGSGSGGTTGAGSGSSGGSGTSGSGSSGGGAGGR